VLYAGRVAESNDVKAIFATPRHPYTQALIRCIPREGMAPGSLAGIPGSVPGVASYPSGCRFHPRCPVCMPRCQDTAPILERLPSGAEVACYAATLAEAANG